jgi:hypothetical protein
VAPPEWAQDKSFRVTFDVAFRQAKQSFNGFKKTYKNQQTEGGETKQQMSQQKATRTLRREAVSI